MSDNLDVKTDDATAEAEINAKENKHGTFAALRVPNFRLLFSGYVLSSAINWILNIILSWLVYDITGSGTILGTINLAMTLVSVAMCLFVGFLVDYCNRRRLMLTETSVIFGVILGLGIILLTGSNNIALIYIFVIVYGAMLTLDSTVRQVIMFDVVPRPDTPNALVLNQTGWSLMRILGPAIGGFLLIWLHAGGSFIAMAVVCMLIIVTVILLKVPPRTPIRSSPLLNIKNGVGFIIKEPTTRIFTIVTLIG